MPGAILSTPFWRSGWVFVQLGRDVEKLLLLEVFAAVVANNVVGTVVDVEVELEVEAEVEVEVVGLVFAKEGSLNRCSRDAALAVDVIEKVR
jgi:hypothetical protein